MFRDKFCGAFVLHLRLLGLLFILLLIIERAVMAEEMALVLTNVVYDNVVYDNVVSDSFVHDKVVSDYTVSEDTFGRTWGRTWKFDCYTDPGYLDSVASLKPAKPRKSKVNSQADYIRDCPPGSPSDCPEAYLNNLEVVVQRGTVIDGNFRFDRPVCIEGKLIGNLNSSELVVVGFNAEICGKVSAKKLIVIGSVIGEANVEEALVIKSTGYVDGDVRVSSLLSEEGATFYGHALLRLGH